MSSMNDIDYDDVSSDTDESVDELNESESDDSEFYEATKMTDDEVQAIDTLWDEENVDIEPYEAKHMSEEEIQAIDTLWKEENADIEPYEANRMSEEEVQAIDTLWSDNNNLGTDENTDLKEDYRHDEYSAEEFLVDVDNMTREELLQVKEELLEYRDMNDEDIMQKAANGSDLITSETTQNMDKESLEQLRENIIMGDPDTYELLGLREEDEDTSDKHVLARRK